MTGRRRCSIGPCANVELTDIADYFDWYNTARPHSSLDRITPEQAYLNLLPKLAEAA